MTILKTLAGCALCAVLTLTEGADAMTVVISTNFPGGNALVSANDGNVVTVTPDLRGGKPWFYWNFEATASQPGTVEFVFPGTFQIGVRGPAVSVDGGRSWKWLGADSVRYAGPSGTNAPAPRRETFTYSFTAAHPRVRFAVAIPYLQSELDAFLARNASNPHLSQGVLTRTRQGRPVELLQIGKPGPGVQPVLVTARHHACESMASYVLEGFLQEALSDSPGAIEFRRKYVLYAVPMVDKDGVQAGDQGKGREPHDHNRDYGQTHLYPEVKAIQELVEARNIPFVMDFHCPALRGDVHEVCYFYGITLPHILDNVNELGAWMTEELPPVFSRGPINFMKKPAACVPTNGLPCAIYFAYQPRTILSVTLEVPYTQPGCPLDAAMARAYGHSLLTAWSRAAFRDSAGQLANPAATNIPLAVFRAEFQKLYKSQPGEVERMANTFLQDPNAPTVHQLESHVLMGGLRFHQRRYADALAHCQTVKDDPRATLRQRATALVQLALIACADSNAAPERLTATLADFEALAYASAEQKAQVYGAFCAYYQARGDFRRALEFAERQKPNVPPYATGNVLNTIAALHDRLQEKDKALAARQEAVALLRAQLSSLQKSVFGAMVAGDLCIALNGIPTATPAEKQEAYDQFINHPVCPDWLKDKVRKALQAE